jgi:hypothetical protein
MKSVFDNAMSSLTAPQLRKMDLEATVLSLDAASPLRQLFSSRILNIERLSRRVSRLQSTYSRSFRKGLSTGAKRARPRRLVLCLSRSFRQGSHRSSFFLGHVNPIYVPIGRVRRRLPPWHSSHATPDFKGCWR